MEIIDFSKAKEIYQKYGGAGKKKTLILNGVQYLVKFQNPVRKKGKNIQVSYVNSVYSEYIGSKIFESVGIETQEVVIGTYEGRIVCACKDFLKEKNTNIESEVGEAKLIEFEEWSKAYELDNTLTMDIKSIYQSLENVYKYVPNHINVENIKEKFWEMFVIDFFIGNTDRHNNNWGFIYYENQLDTYFVNMEFAPIFDCGSSLTPVLTDEQMEEILKSKGELENYVKNAYSAIMEVGKKIHSYEYLKSNKNEYCNKAIKKLVPKMNMEYIKKLINEMPISEIRKEFYITILQKRYELLKKMCEQN
ncbi:MAG: hypothetical protein HFJ52_06410 [Clostridia bacterium]|nr:hypothetical protein [Clostridia bacterium]